MALLIRSGQWVIQLWVQWPSAWPGYSPTFPSAVRSGTEVQPHAAYAELFCSCTNDFMHLMDIFSFSSRACSAGHHYRSWHLSSAQAVGLGGFAERNKCHWEVSPVNKRGYFRVDNQPLPLLIKVCPEIFRVLTLKRACSISSSWVSVPLKCQSLLLGLGKQIIVVKYSPPWNVHF